MAPTVPDGHVGNLTPEQETKLRELWGAVFKLYEALEANKNGEAKEEAPKPEAPKKTRWFGLRASNEPAQTPQSHAVLEALKLDSNEDDKFGLVKQFQHVVTTHSPETIRAMLLGAVKHENPDALALRFLRARKWDINRGLVMMFSALNWRSEAKVDEDIMLHGEEGGAKDCESGENMSKSMAKDFMFQMRMGKSYLHGVDREGRPISSVRVRLHKSSDQCVESIERYTTYLIETTRFALDPPVETGVSASTPPPLKTPMLTTQTLIFDMTNFTLANMDYVPVKFIIKCFEANYPESLGAILLHNAPWVFKSAPLLPLFLSPR